VCSYQPRPTTSYTVSAISRHTADYTTGRSWVTIICDGVGTQMSWSCRRQYVTMQAWVGQTDDLLRNLWHHDHQAPNVVPTHRAIHIDCLPYTSQSVNQAKQRSLAAYVACEPDASHCAQRPPTTNVSHTTTACCQFYHRLIISYRNSKRGYEIIQVSHSQKMGCKRKLIRLSKWDMDTELVTKA